MNIIKNISTLILGFSMIFVSLSWADDDPQTAKMRSACDSENNSAACFRMGERYRIVERDNKNALIFYKKSCDAGYMTGCTNGGNLLYMKGTQYSKQWKEAKKCIKRPVMQEKIVPVLTLDQLTTEKEDKKRQ